MGGAASKYRVQANLSPLVECPWVATRDTDIGAMRFENFRPQKAVGKGKFGLVFLAESVKSSKFVAIKYIPHEFVFAGKHADRVDQELKVLQGLSHPFVVHFFGAFKTNAATAMVFEFVMGGELYMRMKKRNKMSEEEAKFYFCELASTLNYLHNSVSVVYRDIKPENVLIDASGHIRICDFGFACHLKSMSTLSEGCGTIMYLAPEIAAGYSNTSYGYPVDWWSLGCVLYEMLCGDAPFGDMDRANKFEILNNINGSTPKYPVFMNAELKTVLQGLLYKDPSRRWKWDEVSMSGWLSEINWSDVDECRLRPPWIPKANSSPSTDNFLSWSELTVPMGTASTEALHYCQDNISVEMRSTHNKATLTHQPSKLLQKAKSKIGQNTSKSPSGSAFNSSQRSDSSLHNKGGRSRESSTMNIGGSSREVRRTLDSGVSFSNQAGGGSGGSGGNGINKQKGSNRHSFDVSDQPSSHPGSAHDDAGSMPGSRRTSGGRGNAGLKSRHKR